MQIGDIVDGRDKSVGAWFEAKIIKIVTDDGKNEQSKGEGEEKAVIKESTGNNAMEVDNKDCVKSEVKPEGKDNRLAPQTESDGFIYHVVFDG